MSLPLALEAKDVQNLNRAELEELEKLLSEYERRSRTNRLAEMFPDEGELRRELYPIQTAFFKAGADFRERALIAGNRTGKTETALTEVVYHATGDYPHWWTGHRYRHPPLIWCVGRNAEQVKDVLQKKLLGSFFDQGTGLIPKTKLLETILRAGVRESIQTIRVAHSTDGIPDGTAEIVLKSYEQGRQALEGAAVNFIHLDEEPNDPEVHTECLMRTAKCDHCGKCKGRLIFTFTPLLGLSTVVLSFLPGGKFPFDNVNRTNNKWVAQITWQDAPHLSEEVKAEILAGVPEWQRDARTRGIPRLGAGIVYPVSETTIACDPFPIPAHWPRVYGLDIGHQTAAVWVARNPDTNVWYLYGEHYAEYQNAPTNANAILARGAWIPGVIDPSACRSQYDGTKMIEAYMDLGLRISPANNAVEAGISFCWQMLATGQLKVFTSCTKFFDEYRTYHWDDKGKITDGQDDHLLDAWRYVMMSGLQLALAPPDEDDDPTTPFSFEPRFNGAAKSIGY